jgi:hypothetical protein
MAEDGEKCPIVKLATRASKKALMQGFFFARSRTRAQ